MSQRCAQILNGVVTNIVIADPATFSPGGGSLIVASDVAEIGWTYTGGAFAPPVPSARVYQTSGLTFLQFMALFAAAEQAAIVGSGDAQVRLFILMATGGGALDLTNPEVVGGVNYLASLGLIAVARVSRILTGAPPA